MREVRDSVVGLERQPARLLAGAYLIAAAVLLAESAALPAAWRPLEEAAVLGAARGGGATIEPLSGPLFAWLLAPVAGSVSAAALHGLAQTLSALLWAGLVVPGYLVARRGLSPLGAAAAGLAAALVPGSMYALAAEPDALATLLGACALAVAVGASERGSAPRLAAAVALAAAAALARPALLLLPLALALAYALPRVRWREEARWPRTAALAVVPVVAYAAHAALVDSWPSLERAVSYPRAVVDAGLASAAPLVVGIGLLPWLLAPSVLRRPAHDAVSAVLLVSAPALALGAGAAAVGRDGIGLDERPLLVLAPVLVGLAACAWQARAISTLGALAAAGLAVVALAAVPEQNLAAPVVVHEATGFALLGAADLVASLLPVGVIAIALALALLLSPEPRRLGVAGAAVVIVLAGHAAAWDAVHGEAQRYSGSVPHPLDWLDRSVPEGERVPVISAGEEASLLRLAQVAIWNRALGARIAVDPARANVATGALPDVPPARFALVGGAELAGEQIVDTSLGSLVELDRPVRLAQTLEGVAGDGWAGAEAVYRRFGGGVERVRVSIGRRSWGGEDVPGTVTVRVGPLEGELVERARVVIHAAQQTEVVVDAPPAPFRIVVTTTPTFSPSDFGLADTRELGAQLSFEPVTG